MLCIFLGLNGASVCTLELDPEQLLDAATIQPAGSFVDVEVPDTLDLTQRGAFSVNVLTHTMNPANFYGIQSLTFGPVVKVQEKENWDLTCKYARALPAMRVMSGSTLNIDIKIDMM